MADDLSGATAAVIGAGVSGMSCALRLAEAGARVRVLAAEPPPRTVSAVAAACWYPFRAYPEALVTSWSRRAREVFDALAEVGGSGVARREGVELFRTPQPDPWWRPAVRVFRRLQSSELRAGAVDGWAFEAPIIDMGRYLPYLVRQLDARGIAIEPCSLARIEDAPPADFTIDCAGLGAGALAPDPAVHPIRGQVVRVENPGLERFLIMDDHPEGMAYVIPRFDDVVVGGTAEDGATSLHPDPAKTAAILRRGADLEPALVGARVLEVKVGLRPGRPSIRLEVERRGGRTIVHNYGHGGAGVTVSWGCAEAVVAAVKSANRSPA